MNKIVYFILAAVWLIADQWSKIWAVAELKDKHQVIDVLPVLRWLYAENHGAAFGMLSDQGGWQKWFFLIVGAVAVVMLTVMIIRHLYALNHHLSLSVKWGVVEALIC